MMTIASFEYFFNRLVNGYDTCTAVIETGRNFSVKPPKIAGTRIAAFAYLHAPNKFSPAYDLSYKPFGRIEWDIILLGKSKAFL